MFEWWKDLVSPIRIHDPRFGPLRFLRDACFWEGRAAFEPVGTDIEVILFGSEAGPTEQQRSFFADVQRHYRALWPAVQTRLLDEARRVKLSDPRFELAAIVLPSNPTATAEWQLTYDTEPASWHFTVTVQDWQPKTAFAEC
jgi:hypothetical protein